MQHFFKKIIFLSKKFNKTIEENDLNIQNILKNYKKSRKMVASILELSYNQINANVFVK
ncbi:hypothetical protein HMPREF1109_1603 [Streptococcus intermedius SK54 = ATCC 27335]|nr:hypothetical protein HMPREF1109_1603 [Streptococcus intermedius SK54 = ATCC 27335]